MKKTKTFLLGMILISDLITTSCGQTPASNSKSEQSSGFQDESIFKTIKIENQDWMVENLNIEKFRNGDLIPQKETVEEWKIAGKEKKPAWCYYMYDHNNKNSYGKLYNWYAINDERGFAPIGWHVPSDTEWSNLQNYLGRDAGNKLKNTTGWQKNIGQTNESGFCGYPSGICFETGMFTSEDCSRWWSTSVDSTSGYIWVRGLSENDDKLGRGFGGKEDGYSVRCLRD